SSKLSTGSYSLGCRGPSHDTPGGGNLLGKRLALGPHGPILEELFLPDGNRLLEGVNEPGASFKAGGAVGRSHRDQHAGLAMLQPSEAMDQRHFTNVKALQRLVRQFFQLADGHRLISFVLQV